ncbi:type II secretion system F family protein [Actinokineospora pegani]|uniref:type II secretion system F family protein n=1 Tax=Actinokineospora pegani TaxID=2654637 RepID=UPI0012EAEB37|nr:type II secretion system F family protein [Actinokineospora pegani]
MLSLLLLAGAIVSWPATASTRRLRALNPHRTPRRVAQPKPVLLALAAAITGWFALGPAGAIAALLAGGTFLRARRERRRHHDTLSGVEAFTEAIGAFVTELSAGAHPASAAERVALDADPAAARALLATASAIRLGGDVGQASAGARLPAALTPVADQLGRAWALATRHGLPLAPILDAVRRDLDHRVRFARQVQARMAGPRSSAAVLAGLPVAGVLIGAAVGAAPLDVFKGSAFGQGLLVFGVLLACAGTAWTARLTHQVVLR